MSRPTAADHHASPPVHLSALTRDRDAVTPLPAPLTSFVGREREVAAIQRLLRRSDARLLVLTGPPGVGKTRLALQAATGLCAEFADGIHFLSVSSIGESGFVIPEIAERLNIRAAGSRLPIEQLKSALRHQQLLLVLDNFEQALSSAPALVELLTACPLLKALVTSRVVLHVSGEYDFMVKPLDVPDPDEPNPFEQVAQSESVRLFTERATAANADFALTPRNAAAVAAICARADGLPLAIELAAARARALSPQAMLARMDRRLPLMTGGARDLPARQQTMRGAIAWSHDLLSHDEQRLFRRLAVFVGGCTLDAVTAVAGFEQAQPEDQQATPPGGDVSEPPGLSLIFGRLEALVDHHLLRKFDQVDSEPRFVMLETVREYALEQLAASGEANLVHSRHSAWCMDLAEQAWQAFRRHSHDTDWLERLDADHDNLRAALTWLSDANGADLEHAGLQMAGALWPFWHFRNHLAEGRRWFTRVVHNRPAARSEAQARALLGAGDLAHKQGDVAEATILLEQSLAAYRTLDDAWGIGFSLMLLGSVAENLGEYERAGMLLTEGRGYLARTASPPHEALALYHLGVVAYGERNLPRAVAHLNDALRLARPTGDTFVAAWTLNSLGLVLCEQGDYAGTATALQESLDLARANGHQEKIADSLANLAVLAAAREEQELAARLFGIADALCQVVGRPFTLPERETYERVMEVTRERLGHAAFAAAWSAGQGLKPEQALAEALEYVAAMATAPAAARRLHAVGHAGLTARQLEVLRLIAEGRTDREIAAQLSISPRTAATHVTRILTALQLGSRTAAAAYAIRHGLA